MPEQVKDLERELKDLRDGLGLYDRKLSERLRKANRLREKWEISLDWTEGEVRAKVSDELTQLAEWLIEVNAGYGKDGKNHKQLAMIFRTMFNMDDVEPAGILKERRKRLEAMLHCSDKTIRNREDEAIRHVAEHLSESSMGKGSGAGAEPSTVTNTRPELYLDGWYLEEVTFKTDVFRHEQQATTERYKIVSVRDGVDRIGLLVHSILGKDGKPTFPEVENTPRAFGRNVVTRRLSESLLHRSFELGGSGLKGDRSEVWCSTYLEGPACASVFTPLVPCKRLVVEASFTAAHTEEAALRHQVPRSFPEVYSVSNVPSELIRDFINHYRRFGPTTHVSGDPVSSLYLFVDRCEAIAIEGNWPRFAAEFPNLRVGLTYGLIWTWPWDDLPLRTPEGPDSEKPRPSPEGEGGEDC